MLIHIYANKERVKVYKLALDKTLIFFDTIKKGFGQNGIEEFSSLLSLEEDNLRFWAAALLQDRSQVNDIIADKALKIITNAATGDGAKTFITWLENFENTKYF